MLKKPDWFDERVINKGGHLEYFKFKKYTLKYKLGKDCDTATRERCDYRETESSMCAVARIVRPLSS